MTTSLHYKILLYLNIFTFPGTIAHEASHHLMCILRNVNVFKVVYFNPFPTRNCMGEVVHARTTSFNDMLISFAPMIFPLFLAIPIYILSIIVWPYFLFGSILLFWLAFSISSQALPSGGDLASSFNSCEEDLDKGKILPNLYIIILVSAAIPIFLRDYGMGIFYALIIFGFSLDIITYLAL